MKLELAILAGDESKKFLAGLTQQLDRFEKLVAALKMGLTLEKAAALEEEEEEVEEVAPKVKPKKAKKVVEEVEEEDAETEDDEDADEEDAEASDDEDTDGDDEEEAEDDGAEEADESDDEADVDDAEDDEVESAPVKKGKSKKVTSDDCNDAARALAMSIKGAKGAGREKVLSLMQKHFKVTSVADLKPEQYEKFVSVMKKATKE